MGTAVPDLVSALLLHNARLLLSEPEDAAQAVAVRDGRIVAVGSAATAAQALDADAERVDCGGGVLLPAFIDAHCHLLAYAASLRSADCTNATRIADVQDVVRTKAGETPAGEWVRAFGYEETALEEGRHPNRHDLDAAAPGHPVRLVHRGGHASVLNSLGLQRAGIGTATEEPPGGSMEREPTSGEPSGVLLEMDGVIDRAVPALPYEELASGVREASARLLRAGITCVQDATHTNGRAEWDLFERLIAEGVLPHRVVLMEGIDHMGELPKQGADGRLSRGPVKIMLREPGEEISPDAAELARQVAAVHGSGRQAAIHAVGERAIVAAVDAIEAAQRQRPRAGQRHRIEHCGLLAEGTASRLAQLGVIVVSQPSFVFERGERYLKLVPVAQQRSLYAFRTLADAGVMLAAGSDAPVTAPAPLVAVAAAVDRRSAQGRPVAAGQSVAPGAALRWWTAGAAYAGALEEERGAIRPGLRADLALVPLDPRELTPEELRGLRVERLWLDGRPAESA